jgi:spore germination cell wall hydrolase CwlJ-like protein
MRHRAFPDIVQNTLPQVTNQHRHASTTNKDKVTNKDHPMMNRTQQASTVALQITDMLKHGYEIYDVLRHYEQVNASQGDKHYHKAIFTTTMLLMGRV